MTVPKTLSRGRLLGASMRLSALLLVLVLFAVLVYRIVDGVSGAGFTRAVNAHRSPAAPNVKLSVIWAQAGTWPQRLRASVDRGTLWLSDLRGYPVVLNFWASWCGPCQREAAVLVSAAEARRGRVVFVGVDVNDLAGDLAATTRTLLIAAICETGANSFMSYGSSLNRDGLTAAFPTGTTASV